MALRARFVKPLQIVATAEMRAAVEEIADREEVSLAAVYRRLIAIGLESERRKK